MYIDVETIHKIYRKYISAVDWAKLLLGKPLTLTEKILYAHLYEEMPALPYGRWVDYVDFAPDRVAMQDASAQMALLQFMNAGKTTTAVPTTIHCDHLVQANAGAKADLDFAFAQNQEMYDFLQTVSAKYGIGFWKPGAGIIHQILFENYVFPGGMMIGTDSHTVNAGGLGMLAMGVGGADVVDVMAGMPWELKMPKIIGVKLTGRLSGWTSPKDVILKVAGLLTVKGAMGYVIEYFGEGADAISATGKSTICNMGAETGATTSVFQYDEKMSNYLHETGRKTIADLASQMGEYLKTDKEVLLSPEKYYDKVIEIDLSKLEPYINGPFTPDTAIPISAFAKEVKIKGYPLKIEAGLIGSCNNSSYEDLTRAASIARQAKENNLKIKTGFIVIPGSEQIRLTAEHDGLLQDFESIGGIIMANACGPCIGQWKRHGNDSERKNSIITSFNRNFAKRNDGNMNTHAFVASPEIIMAIAIAGTLTFNPLTDYLENEDGDLVMFEEPEGIELPLDGFIADDDGFLSPPEDRDAINIEVQPWSDRLQLLTPFDAWNGRDFLRLHLLIKVKGKCTSENISMAGSWLRFRGHLDNISNNLLIGAVNAFNDKTNCVKNQITSKYVPVPETARAYKPEGGSIIVGEENYGEGSTREHATMEPRHLGVKVVLVKSFARVHEINLKKQGVLALTFWNEQDYENIQEDDRIDITGLASFVPDKPLRVILHHCNGSSESFLASHTYNEAQIAWFKAGSTLNLLRKEADKL